MLVPMDVSDTVMAVPSSFIVRSTLEKELATTNNHILHVRVVDRKLSHGTVKSNFPEKTCAMKMANSRYSMKNPVCTYTRFCYRISIWYQNRFLAFEKCGRMLVRRDSIKNGCQSHKTTLTLDNENTNS
jgi:hypothetical protein